MLLPLKKKNSFCFKDIKTNQKNQWILEFRMAPHGIGEACSWDPPFCCCKTVGVFLVTDLIIVGFLT